MSLSFKITNGDVTHSSANGRPILITEGKKLRQDLTEFFTVFTQPNGFGAGIEELVGIVETSPEAFQGLTYKQIADGLDILISLQNSESKIPRSSAEKIILFNNVRVEIDPSDPTRFIIQVNAVTESGIQLPFSTTIAI